MKKITMVFMVVVSLMMFVTGCSNVKRTSDKEVAMAISEEAAEDTSEAEMEADEDEKPKIFINGQEWKEGEEISLGTTEVWVVELDTRPGLTMDLYHFEDSEYKVISSMPMIYYLTEEHEDGDYSRIKLISSVVSKEESDELIAISEDYMLFDTNEGKIAVSLSEVQGEYDQEEYPYEFLVEKEGGYHPRIKYEDLSAEAQEDFHYLENVETIEW